MKKEPRTSAVKRIRKSQLIDPIIAFLEKNKTQAYNYKQISYGIGALHPSNKLDIINILDDLAADDRIVVPHASPERRQGAGDDLCPQARSGSRGEGREDSGAEGPGLYRHPES